MSPSSEGRDIIDENYSIQLEAFESKWVNSVLNIIEVNSLRLGGLQLSSYFREITNLPTLNPWIDDEFVAFQVTVNFSLSASTETLLIMGWGQNSIDDDNKKARPRIIWKHIKYIISFRLHLILKETFLLYSTIVDI